MCKNIAIFLLICLMLIGIFFLFYPRIHARQLTVDLAHRVQEFQDTYHPEIPVTEPSSAEIKQPESMPYEALLEAAKKYNQKIYAEKQAELCDPLAYEQPALDLLNFGMETPVFGVLKVPCIELAMPIYLGASEDNLFKGVCVMGQTSIPIGGENTNAVIAGHRGWDGAGYLVDIDEICLGDDIYITNPWETLCYRAVEIKIIQPDDVEAIHIQEGRDLLTLLTCHPYRSGGLQRYLVVCERVL